MFVLEINLLHTDATGSHSIVIGEIRQFNEVLGTVLANSGPALPTVVLALQEAKCRVADKAV